MSKKDKLIPTGITPKQKEILEIIPINKPIHSSEIEEKLNISSKALLDRLRRIESSQPNLLSKKRSGQKGFEITFNNPLTLEQRLDNPDDIKIKNLYMGEMSFGTKAYDPDSMTGLKLFLEYNAHTDVNNVMMLGALVPRVPEYYSVSGSEDMRFLAKDPTKKASKEIELMLKTAKLKPSDAQYFKDHVDGKITTRQDAVNAARVEIDKLADILNKAEWHYQHGEEDRENIKVTKEILIADAARDKQDLAKYEKEIERLKPLAEKLQLQKERINSQKDLMIYVGSRIQSLGDKTEDELKGYLVELVQANFEKYSIDDESKKDIFGFINNKGLTKEKIVEEKNKLKIIASDLRKDEQALQAQMKEQEHKINAVERQKEAWGFFRGTKRHKVEADEEEVFFRIAKTDYNDLLYQAFPEAIKERAHIHSSAFNELTDILSNEGLKSEKLVGEEEEYKVVKGKHGLIYLLAHNPNMLNSNTATKKDLRMMKDEVKRLVKLYDVLGIPIPDVTLSSHGKGGFRYQPQMKFRETIIQGQKRLIPETVLHIKLPTLQSIPKLEVLRNRGVRNVHTKRYNAGNFASGVVLHTVYENNRFEIEYIDESTLREFASIGKEIEKKKSLLEKTKCQEGEKFEQKAIKLKSEISDLEKKLLVSDLIKIEADGDNHLGSPNEPGRASNYQMVDAVQRFQRHYGLPQVVVLSEAIHAGIPRVCDTNQQYLGLTPKNFEALLNDIEHSDEYTVKEKLKRMKEVAVEQVHATAITHIDFTLQEWRDRCLPYIEEVLKKEGRLIIASGNHYNKAGVGRDEATALANMIPLAYKDQVEEFHAKGDSIGCGETILPGGKTLYATHKLRDGIDEFVNAMDQILRQGITSDVVMHFDRHHGGGAFADNTIFCMSPGRQTWNKYVDQISKLSSPSGLVNVYVPKDSDIKYAKWEWALSDCLENYFMEPKTDQTLLQRKSFIPTEPETLK